MNVTTNISEQYFSKIILVSILAILNCLGWSSCTTTQTESHALSTTREALIGKTQKELLSCVRIRPHVKTMDERTELKFYKEASQFEESFPGTKSSFPRAHHGCWASVFLQNDRVQAVQYRSVPALYLDDDHCDEIFEPCLTQ